MPMEAQIVVGKKDLLQHSRKYTISKPALQVNIYTARSERDFGFI